MSFKVVVTDSNFEKLDAFTDELKIIDDLNLEILNERSADALIPLVKDADAIFTHFADINSKLLSSLDHCEIVVRPAIGFDNIDVDAATKKGIYVVNIPEYGAQHDVSNHVMMLMLALEKKLWPLVKATKQGVWDQNIAKPVRRLNGQVFGLCGFGRIPKRVAAKAQAFEMEVIAYDPFVDADAMAQFGVRKVEFDELCKESDVISITLPLNESTKYLFDEKAFSMMKPESFIINTARGAVIKEEALIKALESKQIAGAALDVVERENLPKDQVMPKDHPFTKMDNVIVTPHSGWMSEDSEVSLLKQCGEQVVEVWKNGKPTHSVNTF